MVYAIHDAIELAFIVDVKTRHFPDEHIILLVKAISMEPGVVLCLDDEVGNVASPTR